jgi:hypothetical protein
MIHFAAAMRLRKSLIAAAFIAHIRSAMGCGPLSLLKAVRAAYSSLCRTASLELIAVWYET